MNKRVKVGFIELDWVDVKRYGCPDEEGMYLCKFNDGALETFQYMAGDSETCPYWMSEGNLYVTWWTTIPAEMDPEYDPSPDDQESVTRIGGWG